MSIRSIKSAETLGFNVKCLEKNDKKPKEQKCEDFDDILDIIGTQGKFQKFLLYVVLCPITAIEPILALNILFMLYDGQDHWCFVPGRGNISLEAWKNTTIPREEDGSFSKCEMFSTNFSKTSCNAGWEYDQTDYSLTIPSEFDWVCEKQEYATWSLTISSIGNAFGTILYGAMADRIGRKPVFFWCLFLNVFGRLASIFVPSNFYAFLALTFITGTGFPMVFIAPCMISAEVGDKVFRAWIYSVTWMIWVVGMSLLPLIAWLSGNWYYIGLITTLPMILTFLYYNYIPESPRWLISVGRIQDAAIVIQQIAKANGTSDKLSDDKLGYMLKLLAIKQDQCDKRMGVWTLFSRPRLATKTTLLTIAWVMNAVIYYAITLNASNLSGNQFLNFFILAIIELPAGYLGSVIVDKGGRRWTQVVFFILCTVTSIICGIAALHHKESTGIWGIVAVIGAVLSKFAITLTFLVVYLQGMELFPTQLRSTGSGFASTMGSVIGIFTPYIVYLSKYNMGAPWFVIGVMALMGMISSAFLPETFNQSLPETIDEAENFGKGMKFWSIIPTPTSKSTEKKVEC